MVDASLGVDVEGELYGVRQDYAAFMEGCTKVCYTNLKRRGRFMAPEEIQNAHG